MFESLSDRLSGIFDKLTKRGALSEADVAEALREVRRALIEADVALEVVRGFVEEVRQKAVGVEVIKSVTPGQMVVKIVNDALVDALETSADDDETVFICEFVRQFLRQRFAARGSRCLHWHRRVRWSVRWHELRMQLPWR